ALFGVLAASMSISEEIEGRTAITLMSKPLSRRQFLIGKFTGLLMAGVVMTGILSTVFASMLIFKQWYDKDDTVKIPVWLDPAVARWSAAIGDGAAYFLRGAFWWLDDIGRLLPGVLIGFCQVAVLLAIAVALATRLPMIVNLVVCMVV